MCTATTDATTTMPPDPSQPQLRLTRLRREAAQLIKNQITIGNAIKSQRIIYVEDLDEARREKQEWVTRTTDLLKQLFSDGSIAEQCNDWVGPILPEYAEFDLFVEQFVNEMRHRISRLAELIKRLEEFPEPIEAAAAQPAVTSPPVVSSHREQIATAARAPVVLLAVADDAQLASVMRFLEKLHLKGHVCVLGRECDEKGAVRQIAFDSAGAWELLLARQLKASGVPIDLNRLA